MTDHRVSIVIPTRNGAATLPALLDAIWRQRLPWPVETIAIDSGSTDGTVDVAAGQGRSLHSDSGRIRSTTG